MRIKVTLFTLLLFFTFVGYSQNKHYKAISVNVLPWIDPYTTIFQSSFEYSLNKSFSLGLSLEEGKFNTDDIDDVEVGNLRGWGFMPQFKYYPFTKNKPAPFGFFIGTYLRYRILQENYDYNQVNVSTNGHSLDAGAFLGYKIVLGPINFEFLFGGGFGNGSFKTPNQRNLIDPDFRNNLSDPDNYLRGEINIGFHFPQFKRKRKK